MVLNVTTKKGEQNTVMKKRLSSLTLNTLKLESVGGGCLLVGMEVGWGGVSRDNRLFYLELSLQPEKLTMMSFT